MVWRLTHSDDLENTVRAATLAVLLAFAMPNAAAHAAPDAAARLKAHVRVLASDAYLGRAPATRGEQLTLDYISAALAKAGFEGAGAGGGFLQPVPLAIYHRQGAVDLTVEVDGRTQILAAGRDVTVSSRIADTTLNRAPLVFAGYGVVAPEASWDDYAGVDMRGKIAVVLANDPDFDKVEGPFGGTSPTLHGKVAVKVEAARLAGAAGLLIVHSQPASRIAWTAYQAADAEPVWDLDAGEAAFGLRGWIGQEAAARLFESAGLDFAALKKRAGQPGFRAVQMADAVLSTRFATRIEPKVSHNVVAVLKGATRPDESVLVGAHWDAYGVATGKDAVSDDPIRNGAVDNAIGVAQLIELSQRLGAGPRPARSIVLVAYTAEEKDLLGSAYYAAHPALPMATTVAALNLDPHQLLAASRNVELIGKGLSDLDALLENAARDRGLTVERETNPEAGWWLRSDQVSIARQGVPALYFRMGRDLIGGGRAAGDAASQAYMRDRYHKPTDAFDDAWDMASATAETDLAEEVLRRLADGNQWPQWREPGAGFQRVRQASDAARSSVRNGSAERPRNRPNRAAGR